MRALLDPPLTPKNGQRLQILVPVRVSDPDKQDIRSLADQRKKIDEWLSARTDHPYDLTVLEGTGSGERTGRKEFLQLIEDVETGQYDAVVTEDLGRIARRMAAHSFCEMADDYDTRVIAINDGVDTARSGWQDPSIISSWHHERSNRDTSDRIRRTQRSRFMTGGCLALENFGYVRDPGGKTVEQLHKDDAAEPVFRRWFEMLDADNASFADVARWLRQNNVPPPPNTRGGQWDSYMVGRITYNPILKGLRQHNRRKSRRNFDGEYRSVKADPSELMERRVPHLAFFEEEFYDRVTAKLRSRNAAMRHREYPGNSSRRPRRRTRYPGGVAICGICGRRFVWGGHGRTHYMMCSGARTLKCWNAATFDGVAAAQKIADAIMSEAEAIPEFDAAFTATIAAEAQVVDQRRTQRIGELERKSIETDREISRLVAFIKKSDDPPASVTLELRQLEGSRVQIAGELRQASQSAAAAIQLPSIDVLKELARQHLHDAAPDSDDMKRALQKLVPRILLFPFRLCDGGKVVLRARFRLYLAALVPDAPTADVLARPLERTLTLDLFAPPQREFFRQRIMAERAGGLTEKQAARQCGITRTAARRAAELQREMGRLGIADPYVLLSAPPEDSRKIRRQNSAFFSFEPLPDAGQL